MALLDSLKHRRHVGEALLAPKLLVGLLCAERLSRGIPEGLTFLVVSTTVARVVRLMGPAVSLAQLAKLFGARLPRDSLR